MLPAAVAVAEMVGAGGRALITATVAGYDIGWRALAALGGFAAHTDRGWHSSGTMGSMHTNSRPANVRTGSESISLSSSLPPRLKITIQAAT